MAISEFEKSAQQAAVEAVERRWKHDNDLKRRLRWRSRIGNFLSIVVLLAGLAGMGVFAERFFGFHIPYLSDWEPWQHLTATANDVAQRVGKSEPAVTPEVVLSYDAALANFQLKTCTSWAAVSEKMGPKTAPAGTQYLFLCGHAPGDVRLYQMTAKGGGQVDVVQLVQTKGPWPLKLPEFRAALKGRTAYVSCGGNVYFLGKKLAATAQIELERLLGGRR